MITRARALLKLLEGEQLAPKPSVRASKAGAAASEDQMGLFGGDLPHPVGAAPAHHGSVNTVTPLEALALLAQLSADARLEPDSVAGRRPAG